MAALRVGARRLVLPYHFERQPNRTAVGDGIHCVLATVDDSLSRDHGGAVVLGDPSAFAEAVRPHLTTMARVAARLAPREAPDDVVQEALVRAWRYRRSFDPSKGAFHSWLLGIVANEARRASARVRLPIRIQPPPLDGPASDERIDIANAVQTLPARQRLAVNYRYYVGLTVSETAHLMKCSEGTVKSTLADARATLRVLLEERS